MDPIGGISKGLTSQVRDPTFVLGVFRGTEETAQSANPDLPLVRI